MKLSWFTTDGGRIRVHSLVVADGEMTEMASDIPGWIERHGAASRGGSRKRVRGDASAAGPSRDRVMADHPPRPKSGGGGECPGSRHDTERRRGGMR